MAKRLRRVEPLHVEPDTDDVVEAFMLAYQRISNGRQSGMSANPILFHDMFSYFDRLCWFCDDLELFVDVLQQMDSLMLQKFQESTT